MVRLLRKTLVLIVLLTPLFTNTDCKKQKKCGCTGDVLYTYSGLEYQVFFSEETPIITLMEVGDPYYSTYSVCNPDEIKPKLANFKSGDVLTVAGDIFWDCNYVMQSSNSYSYSYSSMYNRAYNIRVTDIYMNMYGKK